MLSHAPEEPQRTRTVQSKIRDDSDRLLARSIHEPFCCIADPLLLRVKRRTERVCLYPRVPDTHHEERAFSRFRDEPPSTMRTGERAGNQDQ